MASCSPFPPHTPRLVFAQGESGLSCHLGPLRALGGRHWSPASSWQGASSTAVRPPMSVRSPSGDARLVRLADSPSACGWACSRRVSAGQCLSEMGWSSGLGGSLGRRWGGALWGRCFMDTVWSYNSRCASGPCPRWATEVQAAARGGPIAFPRPLPCWSSGSSWRPPEDR